MAEWETPMRIAITKPLFAWDCLQDCPDLQALRDVLAMLPDAKLLDALRHWRGRGRDDYPPHVLWGVVVLKVLLRHVTVQSCLDELKRNPALCRTIGIDNDTQIPNGWNMSRFQEVLGTEPHLSLMREMFDELIRRLGNVVPELGRQTAGDATGLSAQRPRSAGGKNSPLAQPTGGRKEYLDEDGNVTKVLEWFGYKLHLLVDVRHELSLGYQVTSANVGDNEVIPALVDEAKDNLPPDRIETLAYDKAADSNEVHEYLDDQQIAPLVEVRSLWKQEHHRPVPGHEGDNIVHDELGTILCYDTASDPPVQHRMAYIGHEKSRRTLKYRCPAMHGGWRCPNHRRCNAGRKYGKTVRVKREIDLRRFPPIPRATKKFERLYRGRTAVERVNARLKVFWGADDGNVTGAERFHANVSVVMLVHAALATLLAACPRREGTLGQTRLSPIAKALREPSRL
jgi:hypothetical protein